MHRKQKLGNLKWKMLIQISDFEVYSSWEQRWLNLPGQERGGAKMTNVWKIMLIHLFTWTDATYWCALQSKIPWVRICWRKNFKKHFFTFFFSNYFFNFFFQFFFSKFSKKFQNVFKISKFEDKKIRKKKLEIFPNFFFEKMLSHEKILIHFQKKKHQVPSLVLGDSFSERIRVRDPIQAELCACKKKVHWKHCKW